MPNLFQAARLGDESAQAEIHRLIREHARALCERSGPWGDPSFDWEDVAQEVSRKVLNGAAESYRGEGSESSYLFSAVRATMISLGRSGERRRRREEAAGWPEVLSAAGRDETRALRAVLDSLSNSCQDVVVRVFFYGASYSQLSQEFGLAESSVRAKVSRCLQRARSAWTETDTV